VETPAGREYIPDTNSNNIINLDAIYPPPSDPEHKRGYMLRPCGRSDTFPTLTPIILYMTQLIFYIYNTDFNNTVLYNAATCFLR
jgi:hypothetical protein